jgi:RNA polymerase sigma-B factor
MDGPALEPRYSGTDSPTRRLLRAYHERGDTRARERLIELHLPLVRTLARRFRRTGVEEDDLVQVGSIGLINAIDRFDLERGGELTAFAVPNIAGEIRRHLRDKVGAVRLPRGMQELQARIARSESELGSRLGRSPTPAELADELGVPEAELTSALAAGDAHLPVETIDENGDASEDAEAHLLLAGAFDALDERERRIVYLRFIRERSRAEVAKEMGVSPRALSRETQNALAKLRTELEGGGGGQAEPAEKVSRRPRRTLPSMSTRQKPGAEKYLELPYHITVTKEGGESDDDAWGAHVEELPGCDARGRSPAEATEGVRRVMREWIEAAIEEGRAIPEPRAAASHSGKLMLRMPQSLHAELASAAEREGTSLNNYIVSALASVVGREPSRRESRSSLPRAALVANVVVVVLVAVIAIVLLIAAWREGI